MAQSEQHITADYLIGGGVSELMFASRPPHLLYYQNEVGGEDVLVMCIIPPFSVTPDDEFRSGAAATGICDLPLVEVVSSDGLRTRFDVVELTPEQGASVRLLKDKFLQEHNLDDPEAYWKFVKSAST